MQVLPGGACKNRKKRTEKFIANKKESDASERGGKRRQEESREGQEVQEGVSSSFGEGRRAFCLS